MGLLVIFCLSADYSQGWLHGATRFVQVYLPRNNKGLAAAEKIFNDLQRDSQRNCIMTKGRSLTTRCSRDSMSWVVFRRPEPPLIILKVMVPWRGGTELWLTCWKNSLRSVSRTGKNMSISLRFLIIAPEILLHHSNIHNALAIVLAWSFFQYHLSSVWIRSENDFSGAGATWYSNMGRVTQTCVSEKRTNS